jgi:hypothetical protein
MLKKRQIAGAVVSVAFLSLSASLVRAGAVHVQDAGAVHVQDAEMQLLESAGMDTVIVNGEVGHVL